MKRSMRRNKRVTIKVRWSPNLSSAFETLASETFDVIVTDLGLPGCAGIESFLELHARCPGVPVVVLTGLSDEKIAMEAVRRGAQDYLVKGTIDSASFLKVVRYAIERQRLLTELENRVGEIGRLERERSSVLSMFAHDIKNAIIPSVWVLKRSLSGKSGDLKGDLSLTIDNLGTAERLLSDFIEFSRLETRGYLPAKSDFDMRSAVLKQIDAGKAEAGRKDIAVECSVPAESLPSVQADERMIRRVIANLLENAVKYTEAGGVVTVRVKNHSNEILFEIQDTGIGIPYEHIPFIFDAFYRVSADQRGSGLGLAIARTIIESHEGRIWAESMEGKGSIFRFTLPGMPSSHKKSR
ncbi:MAG: response regulator [Nitrospirae bacterium]|nr:response regulator [Nitrospirota bacterium]